MDLVTDEGVGTVTSGQPGDTGMVPNKEATRRVRSLGTSLNNGCSAKQPIT